MQLISKKFDKEYKFCLAKPKDIKKIMEFIKNFWSSDHILANNEKYFTYQYKYLKNINFILSINKQRVFK